MSNICGSLNKRGAGSCTTTRLNSARFEHLVTPKIKEHIRTTENLTKLVQLVNQEMDAASSSYRDEMETITREKDGVDQRLGTLYNAIETGNIEFDILRPRLQELKGQQDRLSARKTALEILLSQRKFELAKPQLVMQYVIDLRRFIDSADLARRRTFIKSFIKEIVVDQKEGQITYTFPIPPDNPEGEKAGVLPIVRYGGR